MSAAPLVFPTIHCQRKYDAMMAALKVEPCSREDLRAKMCCASSTAIRILRLARDAKQVRICQWLRTRGGLYPLYGLGSAPDAERLEPMTMAERHRSLMADKPRNAVRNAKIVACQRKKRLAKFPTIYEDTMDTVIHLRSGGTPQIAQLIGLSVVTVYCVLRELETENKVMRISKKGAMPIRWAVYSEAEPEVLVKQAVVKKWQAPKVSKQNPFSALGIL